MTRPAAAAASRLLLAAALALLAPAPPHATAREGPGTGPAAPDSLAPAAAARGPRQAVGGKKKARRAAAATPAVRWRALAGLEIIYDDNILRYSDDDLVAWEAGVDPDKFRIHSPDDLIVAPSLEVEARHRLVAAGDTRWRVRFKRWGYLNNPIKANSSLTLYARQDLGPNRSLELSYAYSPQQYIRQLTDRPPFAPVDDPLLWESFRYSRNGFSAIARARLTAALAGRVTVERVLRYYNQPFMENDTRSLGARGALTWAAHPRASLTVDYGFERGKARGYDTVGESPSTSDDSDASYDRDLYQVEASWRPRLPRRWFDAVTVTAQHMVYWFTSRRTLVEDPYHVGRQDQTWQFELALERACGPRLGVELGARYARRSVDSPYPGDIVSEDKDYDARRAWLGLTWRI